MALAAGPIEPRPVPSPITSLLLLTVMVLAIAIFSAFILVDVQRVVNGGETNYIMATLAIYLDVYNVFTNLLALLGIFGGNKD